MKTMRAVRLVAPGGPEALELQEIEVPSPGPGEALVRVHAAAITRDELTWPTGRLPAIPSYELSGTVEAVGPGVAEVAAGDAVWALTPFDRDGVAAEYAAVPAAVLAPKPASAGHLACATVPLPALSAWQGLFAHGGLEPGERVLVHGAAGGVGRFAAQLARWKGATVLDSARPSPGSADLVFDTVGAAALAGSAEWLRPGGRIVSVAEEPPADLEAIYFVVEPDRAQLLEIGRLLDAGDLVPAVDSVYPLAEAPAAFGRVAERGKNGKVVIQVVGE